MAVDKERAMKAGCSEYETKPIDFPALLAKIDQFLEGSDTGLQLASVSEHASTLRRAQY